MLQPDARLTNMELENKENSYVLTMTFTQKDGEPQGHTLPVKKHQKIGVVITTIKLLLERLLRALYWKTGPDLTP